MGETRTIRAIAIDIDGTLLNSQHELTAEVERSLREAAAAGVQIILATGKTRNSALHLIDHLTLGTYGIYLQGTAIYDPQGTLKWQETLEPDLLRRVLTFAEDRDFSAIVYSGMKLYVRALNDRVRQGTVKYHEPLPEAIGGLQNLAGRTPVNKVMLIGPDARAITALRWQLSMQLGPSARLLQAGIPNMLEILPPKTGKETALARLLKDLDIQPEQTMAIGDAENDIEMLKLCGVGVAMGQAPAAVKDAADHVTASNDDHGVARAIDRFALHKPEPAESAPEVEKPA